MSIGTAIVVSIGIICGTFLAVVGIGAWMNVKKSKATNDLSKVLTDELTNRLKGNLKK